MAFLSCKISRIRILEQGRDSRLLHLWDICWVLMCRHPAQSCCMRKHPNMSVPCGSRRPWRWCHLVSKLPIQVTYSSQENLLICLCRLFERKSQKVCILLPSEMNTQIRTEAPLWRAGGSVTLGVREIKILKPVVLVPYSLERAQLLVFEDSKIPGGEDPLVTEWLKASLKKRKYKPCASASTRRQQSTGTRQWRHLIVRREEAEGSSEKWCQDNPGGQEGHGFHAEEQSDQRLHTS